MPTLKGELYVALAISGSDGGEPRGPAQRDAKEGDRHALDIASADVLVKGLSSKATDADIRATFEGVCVCGCWACVTFARA